MKRVIEHDLHGGRWFWKIENGKVSIYGEKAYRTYEQAEAACNEFINKCLTDRETWPKEYR